MSEIDLSKFELLDLIGKGQISEVFQVKEIATQKIFAGKILHYGINGDSIDQKEIDILSHELSLMSSIDHPSILKYIGFSSKDFENLPNPTIISNYISSGSLHEIQTNPQPEWTNTKKLINIYGIASAMSYLHSHDVIHQDLKLENILIDDHFYPIISDFCLSKITEHFTKSAFKGTPIYMAPEILQNEQYTKSSDVYAFAIIVYQIITGKIPFENLDFDQLKNSIVSQKVRPEIPQDVPKPYKDLIEKCWSQDPKERPTFEDIVNQMKNEKEFVNETIEKVEFFEYIESHKPTNEQKDSFFSFSTIKNFIGRFTKKEETQQKEQEKETEKSSQKGGFFGFFSDDKEPFEIESQGCILRGFILRPEKEGKLPTVIMSHGFGSCTRETKKYAQVFVDEGYAAFVYDFCMSGSGKSSGSSLGMSVLTEKVDLLNLLDYVKTLDFVDKSRIILAGCSQGGFVSGLAAAEREDDVDRLIMYYPALCIPDDARRGQMINAKFDPKNVPDQLRCLFVKLSSKYVLDVIDMDPYKEICSFKKPVLIVHGTKDKLVNISYSREASEKYPNCKLVEVNGDHGFIFRGFAQSKQATIDFLNEIK